MKRKTGILLVAGLALTLAALGLQSSHTRPKAGSLFSWNRTAVSAEGIEAVLTVKEQLPLTQLFQRKPKSSALSASCTPRGSTVTH